MLVAVWVAVAAMIAYLGWSAATGKGSGGSLFWVVWVAVLLLVGLLDRGVVS